MHTPLLGVGTSLVVVAGPVEADGYTWFRVAPVDVTLSGNVDQGWVAVADRDGTPWVSLADDPTPGYELAVATVDRPKPDVVAARAHAEALNAFGLELYNRLLADPEALPPGRGAVLSPASIATALAMARAGAAGGTATEMDQVLNVEGWDALARGVNALDQLLSAHDGAWTEEDLNGQQSTRQLAIRIANMAFAQRGFPLQPQYVDEVGRTFGSGVGLVDYEGDPSGATEAINGWVNRQTAGRIPSLLSDENVTPDTRVILVNAIYLKAEWARTFAEQATTDRDFTTHAGGTVRVPTMELEGDQDVVLGTGDGWQATQLSYLGRDGTPLAMTLVLPEDLAAFEEALTPETLAGVDRALDAERAAIGQVTDDQECGTYPYNVQLRMPRFGIDTRATLNNALQALGMESAFGAADFSGITTAAPLHISGVIHQANIDVDEHGTEAAAATAVGGDTGGCLGPSPAETRSLHLDRPFMFLLRDVETGAILFMGRVTDPSQR